MTDDENRKFESDFKSFFQLVIALATVATAKPWVYTTGLHYPYAAPVVYAAPPVVQVPVTNTCRNEAGALVPCAQPAGVVGDAVHAYADAAIPGFVQHGALATVAAPAADAAAAEDAVVSVEKRDAEADPEADADADAKSWWYVKIHIFYWFKLDCFSI